MNTLFKLSLANLKHKTARTFYLTALVVFMSFTVFFGATVTLGLNRGLDSLKTRLGADIIVIPRKEANLHQVEGMLFSGKPGYFYMNKSVLDDISSMDGIEKITAQFYLASLTADCCSSEMQLIGIDPDTDFVISPWLNQAYSGDLGEMEVIVGSDVFIPKTGIIKVYNQDLRAVGNLEKTGTGLDITVYGNTDTIKRLLKSAQNLGVTTYSSDPDEMISSVMIKVSRDYDKGKLTEEINKRFTDVMAVENQHMISSFSEKLDVATVVIKTVVGVIWLLALVIIAFAFSMLLNERKREFAVLRVLGFTRKSLLISIFYEIILICAAGSVIGVLLSSFWSLQIKYFLETRLEVPFLFEDYGSFILQGILTIVSSVLMGLVVLIIPVLRVVKTSPEAVLREVD